MSPSFQIDTTGLTGAILVAAQKTNADIDNLQKIAARTNVSQKNQFISAITAAASGYGEDDPNDGQVNPDSGLAYDDLTQTQQLLFIYTEFDSPQSFASADLSALAPVMTANPGPDEPWNISNHGAGLGGSSSNAKLSQGSVITIKGDMTSGFSTVVTSGMVLPQN